METEEKVKKYIGTYDVKKKSKQKDDKKDMPASDEAISGFYTTSFK